MDHMDHLRERVEALEHHARTVERRLRWWRGIACGVVMLSLLSLALPSGKAADSQPGTMAERMATLEKKLTAMTFDDAANEVVITGANLRIVNGLGTTETTNGLGNLIVGYNEPRGNTDLRTGSHNVVVGRRHNFSRFGGLVVGDFNEISGAFAVVSGGASNIASGAFSSVSGGEVNTASNSWSSVSGGSGNTAAGEHSWVSGGEANTADGIVSSVSGGSRNTARGIAAFVSGGEMCTADGFFSAVSGGSGNTASGSFSAVSGGRNNTAAGTGSTVSGGSSNSAGGEDSSVSGGQNRSVSGDFDWAAGPLFADF